MPWASKEERIYSGIAAALKDEGIAELFKQSSGRNITDITNSSDPPLLKFKKSIAFLKKNDNERRLLIYVLANVAGPEAQEVLDAFPDTLKDLPPVEGNVSSAIEFLKRMELYPLSPGLKGILRARRSRFNEIAQCIVMLFVYKSLHNSFLNLLFSINVAESLLTRPDPDVPPNFSIVAGRVDEVVKNGNRDLGLLDACAADAKAAKDAKDAADARLAELRLLSDSLRKAANPASASVVITDIYHSVRETLSQLNARVFAAANGLSFGPLMSELPGKIQDSKEFKEFDQVIRDLTATIRARAFKHKLWLDAEVNLSKIGQSFSEQKADTEVIDLWYALRQSVEWLAALESDAWVEDAKRLSAGVDQEIDKLGVEVEQEISGGEQCSGQIKSYFEEYQSWFREPFSKIDSGLTTDYSYVYRMDLPFSAIWRDLR